MILARAAPSPSTAWVACFHKSQRRHVWGRSAGDTGGASPGLERLSFMKISSVQVQ
jgi:hypothetical protein